MDAASIVLSLNETESVATKAARGAGLSWGEAEDLGRGARWLAARGLDWAGPLLGLLNSPAERAGLESLLRVADRRSARDPGHHTLEPCRPAWALALLATLSRGASTLALRGPGFDARLSPEGVASIDGDDRAVAGGAVAGIVVEVSPDTTPLARALEPNTRRSTVSAARMHELGGFAALTYVPASEASRRLGAGGGRIDDA